jgi:superfamily I DNA and RNA helicase
MTKEHKEHKEHEEHTYRVLIRGRFTDLDETGSARLRAAANQHDMLTTGFSEEGGLSYDKTLDFFSFRVQLRAKAETTDRAVRDQALTKAAHALEELGVDFRDLKAKTTDMNQIKIRRRR